VTRWWSTSARWPIAASDGASGDSFHRARLQPRTAWAWKVPAERVLDVGPRMAAYRGISHCYQRPTYADWPTRFFTMAHGRSKDECDAILDAIAAENPEVQ